GRFSTSRRAPRRSSTLSREKPAAARPCPSAVAAAFHCSWCLAASWPTSPRWRTEQLRYIQMLRINEAPTIEVHIVNSSEPAGGMGEAGTSAIVPGVANAIFAAADKRLRKMPVDGSALKQPV